MHAVHRPTACIGCRGREESGVRDSKADFFSLHISAGLKSSSGLIDAREL